MNANQGTFHEDLRKEKRLASFLDEQYHKHLKNYRFAREKTLSKQHRGIDVVFTHRITHKSFLIDEKAQLDYLNEDLPTFAFELSYLKNRERKKGWLFDTYKKTQFYALITAIYTDVPNCFTSCKVTLVNRNLLLKHFISSF